MAISEVRITTQTSFIHSFSNVPDDLLFRIFSESLTAKDIQSLVLTNQKFYCFISNYYPLWNALLVKHFPHYKIIHHNLAESKDLYKRSITTENNIRIGKYRLQILKGHKSEVSSFHVHGDTLFSGFNNGVIRASDIKSGKELKTFKGHSESVWSIATHRGKLISSSYGCIKIWDIESGNKLHKFKIDEVWVDPLLVHQGKLFAGSEQIIQVWDLENQKELPSIGEHPNYLMNISAYEEKLYSSSNGGAIKVWDLESGRELNFLEDPQYNIRGFIIHNGQLLACSEKSIHFWDLKSGKKLPSFEGHQEDISCISAHRDKLYSSDNNTICIWDLKNGKVLQTLYNHHAHVKEILVHEDKLFFSSKNMIKIVDFGISSVSIYDMQTLEENLSILQKMASTEDKELLVNMLHPNFQLSLWHHALKCSWSFTITQKVVSRVQMEVYLELMLEAIYDKDPNRFSELYKQLKSIDTENDLLHKWFELHCMNVSNQPLKGNETLRQEAIFEIKQSLNERWNVDAPILLVNLGIVSEEEYSKELQCTPDVLEEVGILSLADLQALGVLTTPVLQHLQMADEIVPETNSMHHNQAFNRKKAITDHLQNLSEAVQKRCKEPEKLIGILCDRKNSWNIFSTEILISQACIEEKYQISNVLFSSQDFAEIVRQVNVLIDTFNRMDREYQIAKLRAYIHQFGIEKKWNTLSDQNIDTLAEFVEKNPKADLFKMGEF